MYLLHLSVTQIIWSEKCNANGEKCVGNDVKKKTLLDLIPERVS